MSMSLSTPFETGLVFDPGPKPGWLLARSVLHRSSARSEMLFWEGRWVVLCWVWVCIKQLFRWGWTIRIVGIAYLQDTRWLSGTVYLLGFPSTIPCWTSSTSIFTVDLERSRQLSATCDAPARRLILLGILFFVFLNLIFITARVYKLRLTEVNFLSCFILRQNDFVRCHRSFSVNHFC